MARYTFKMQRLFVRDPLLDQGEIVLDKAQSNYLVNVLRLKEGAELLLFNGRDGEWRAKLSVASKKKATLIVVEQTRAQPLPSSLDYCFAPLKHGRLDYMVQKAVEMGAGRLRPVITQFTQVTKPNIERMQANVIEAAEQCGVLNVPDVMPAARLADCLEQWPKLDAERRLIFCDEGDVGDDPISILKTLEEDKHAVLIGPEGGFSDDERMLLKGLDFVTAIPLGPRIMRADTAAVAALAVLQATRGDWVD